MNETVENLENVHLPVGDEDDTAYNVVDITYVPDVEISSLSPQQAPIVEMEDGELQEDETAEHRALDSEGAHQQQTHQQHESYDENEELEEMEKNEADVTAHYEVESVCSSFSPTITDMVCREATVEKNWFSGSKWANGGELFKDPTVSKFRQGFELIFEHMASSALMKEQLELQMDDLLHKKSDREKAFSAEESKLKRKFEELENEYNLAKDSISANNMDRQRIRNRANEYFESLIRDEQNEFALRISRLEKLKELF